VDFHEARFFHSVCARQHAPKLSVLLEVVKVAAGPIEHGLKCVVQTAEQRCVRNLPEWTTGRQNQCRIQDPRQRRANRAPSTAGGCNAEGSRRYLLEGRALDPQR
jgi:hypothetical protein